jgi:hypothetical protein
LIKVEVGASNEKGGEVPVTLTILTPEAVALTGSVHTCTDVTLLDTKGAVERLGNPNKPVGQLVGSSVTSTFNPSLTSATKTNRRL